MKKIVFIIFILIKSNTLFGQDWSVDLSYNIRDTISSYYIDSDTKMFYYKDINRTRDTREFYNIKISDEQAKEIFSVIQCIKKEKEKLNNTNFRNHIEVFVTLVEKENVIEFSFFEDQYVLLTRLIQLLEECKDREPIFTNFIYSDGPKALPR